MNRERIEVVLYDGELWAMDLRAQISAADRIIVVEGAETFQGERKDRFYGNDRPPPPSSFVRELPTLNVDAMGREHALRNAIGPILRDSDIARDALVAVVDADEFVKPWAWHAVDAWYNAQPNHADHPVDMTADTCVWTLDWRMTWLNLVASISTCDWIIRHGGQATRAVRSHCPHTLQSAVWHLTWQGGPEAARRKLRRIAHPEHLAKAEPGVVEALIARGVDLHGQPLRRDETRAGLPDAVRWSDPSWEIV